MKKKIFFILSVLGFDSFCQEVNIMGKIRTEYRNVLNRPDQSKSGIIQVDPNSNETLYNLIKDTADKMDMDMPDKIFIFKGNEDISKLEKYFALHDPRSVVNSYGLNKNSMCLSIGINLLNILTLPELTSLIANELGHIKLMHFAKHAKIGLLNLILNFAVGRSLKNYLQKNNISFEKRMGIGMLSIYSANYILDNFFMKQCYYEDEQEAMKVLKNKDTLLSALDKQKKAQAPFKKPTLTKLIEMLYYMMLVI